MRKKKKKKNISYVPTSSLWNTSKKRSNVTLDQNLYVHLFVHRLWTSYAGDNRRGLTELLNYVILFKNTKIPIEKKVPIIVESGRIGRNKLAK